MSTQRMHSLLLLLVLPVTVVFGTQPSASYAAEAPAGQIRGQVLGAGAPITNATVTLWAASAEAPRQLAQTRTGPDGRFLLAAPDAPANANLYLIAKGGRPSAGKASDENPAIALLTVLGGKPPADITINEFTTIASVWTHNQFIDGTAIRGSTLALKIAAGNVANLVDVQTGGYGTAIEDALNSGQTPTMANFATLSSVLAGCVTRVKADACSQLFTAATPPVAKAPADTLAVAEAIVRFPSHQADKIFALLDQFYPVPNGKRLRPTPFMPYLTYAPSAWIFPLKFTGGGLSAPGKLMIDGEGNLWAGDNFVVGAQNAEALWAGNLSKLAPNGRPLSPMTTGFTGGGLGGVGFGLALDAQGGAWATTYATHTIAHFDKNGQPLSPSEGYDFNGQLGLMQGIIVAPNGDVWAVSIEKGLVVHLPGGDPSKGRLLCQNKTGNPEDNPCKLAAPFHLAIDQKNQIWIANAAADWVTRFPAADPSKIETFKVGSSPSGMAVDSRGNVWVTNRFGNSERGRAALGRMVADAKAGKDIATVMVHTMVEQKGGPDGGSVTVLRPDGSEQSFSPISGRGLPGPWAAAVDGNDHVWVSNFVNSAAGIVQLCGVRAETCPPGSKTGEAISPPGGYVGGGLQMQVDVGVGPAGDVWVSNNWQDYKSALDRVAEPLSTLGAGQGVVVFYGMAKPVRTPLIGPPRMP
jgi:hypothetical protein